MRHQNGTFWDENRNFKNSTTQHQQVAPLKMGRSSNGTKISISLTATETYTLSRSALLEYCIHREPLHFGQGPLQYPAVSNCLSEEPSLRCRERDGHRLVIYFASPDQIGSVAAPGLALVLQLVLLNQAAWANPSDFCQRAS